ncbi:Ig-like domain-containing protein [Streptomyces sp. NPDC012508]|uniref:Ig-like domain-containing protein n=1 Tax=Streptomyces sp. NPDC012508 TaxID=3364837 RepID=UPI0036C492D2
MTVDLSGAEGGSAVGHVTPNPPTSGAPGGLGGHTRATLAVTPGQVLQLTVGAAGIPGSSRRGEYARPGGYGHGAGGGGAHGGGGSGGGASDLRLGAFGPAERVLVAGEGATSTSHGTGSPNSRLGGPGAPGGDTDPNTGLPNPGSGGNGGGGGGGGWFGGGGGSGGGNPDNLPGAGGGGGSGYAGPATIGARLTSGVHRGNGRAALTWRYDTSLALTADTTTPLYGRSTTLTATVTSPGPTPSGGVAFFDGDAPLGTVPLTDGRAVFRTPVLRPGSHALTARYEGDRAHHASGTPEPVAVTVGFSRPCLTGRHVGPLTARAGESLCLAAGAQQYGPVRIEPGAALAASDAVLTGGLRRRRSRAVPVRSARHRTADRAGDDRTGPLCEGGAGTGPVTFESNTGGTTLAGTTVTGPLRCEGNTPAPETAGITVRGPRHGQCR